MRVECDVWEDTQDGRPCTVAECGRCGHTTTSLGTTERSARRCLVLLREECPKGKKTSMSTPMIDEVAYFVLATDGLLYRNPSLAGADWCLSFDPEHGGAVLEVSTRLISASAKDPDHLCGAMIRGHLPFAACLNKRLAPRLEKRRQPPVWLFPVEILAPLPAACMRPQQGVRQPYGKAHHVLDFGRSWG